MDVSNRQVGVRGWLLVLCVMFVIVGPLLSAWLMNGTYDTLSPRAADSFALRVAMLVSLGLTAASVFFGIHAGLMLWRIQPGAVAMARRALLLGLAVDLVTTAIGVLAVPGPVPGALGQIEIEMAASLVFFTLGLAYLNRSERVRLTYPAEAPARVG